MKKTIIKIIVTTLLLLALGTSSAVADSCTRPGAIPGLAPRCNRVVHCEWLV